MLKEKKKIVKDIAKSALKDKKKGTKKGIILKKELGLDKIESIWVQKILNISISIYIIVFNSRAPSRYFPIAKLKKLKAFRTSRLKIKGFSFITTKFKMTSPIQLKNFDKSLNTGDVILLYDISGEELRNKKIFENINYEVIKI